MKKSFLLMLAVAASFTFVSCSDDDEDTQPNKTELLTNKNWKKTAETETMSNTPGSTDLFTSVPDCTKDDILKFGTNGTFTWNEGASKCDPTDPQEFLNGTWAFTNNETKVMITIPGLGDGELELTELTASKLVTKDVDTDQGVTTTTTTTYIAQ
jgi:hypothetical protein